jgi:hypothetical protein
MSAVCPIDSAAPRNPQGVPRRIPDMAKGQA